ncbi:hypothetical protein CORC01_01210 [Colletotrichum orchidophilum]|uniref:Uncharacterized protein n=1 Tax=Colletotrichum orchidophilum TaxID=1209926 RepID=A0A1G4BPU6_9PEZI|nr:uncharacterized protein CORC01_01210 [Colletotrichum orchidophilum]OHF03491.1 hypothetical protein CORC01_01210 [Colletotrichum orchidophilum]
MYKTERWVWFIAYSGPGPEMFSGGNFHPPDFQFRRAPFPSLSRQSSALPPQPVNTNRARDCIDTCLDQLNRPMPL